MIKTTLQTLILSVLTLAPLAAGACEELLVGIKAELTEVKPFLGRMVDPAAEIPEELRQLIAREGGQLIALGKGLFGRVYRWYRPHHPPVVIKYYFEADDAKGDDQGLNLLRELEREGDLMKPVREVLPPTPNMRFYNDVHGVTLGTLMTSPALKSHPSPETKVQLMQIQQEYLHRLVMNLKARYGAEKISVDSHRLEITGEDGSVLKLNLHSHNVLVDVERGYLWIIDPR